MRDDWPPLTPALLIPWYVCVYDPRADPLTTAASRNSYEIATAPFFLIEF